MAAKDKALRVGNKFEVRMFILACFRSAAFASIVCRFGVPAAESVRPKAMPPIDILTYVALSEEFNAMIQDLGEHFEPEEIKDIAITAFIGEVASPALNRSFHLAVVPAGKMGNTRASAVTSAILHELKPRDVVVIGIAGSLTNDLQPGDVLIPDSVNEYLANAATTGSGETWSFRTSGDNFPTSPRLLNRFQFFGKTRPLNYQQWMNDADKRSIDLVTDRIRESIKAAGLEVRSQCKLYAGDNRKLASGPAVGKGTAFVNWIKGEVDRKIVAIEMESAGVYDAALIRTPAPRSIAIRGISDYADERKEKIEAAARDVFRVLATKNALSLLIRGIEAGLFKEEAAGPMQSVVSVQTSQPDSLVKSVFVIGGITGETADPDSEKLRLEVACLKLGRTLANAGAQLIVCSPFRDSADFYTIVGYSGGRGEGLIQLHSPMHPKVAEKREQLAATVGREGLKILDWQYPGPDNDEAWPQAWLLAQLQALEKADAVIAVGGKVSKTASTLLHLAEARSLTIVPFAFLGGAAGRAFRRRDWSRLNPGFDTSVLEREDGVEAAAQIANRLALDRLSRAYTNGARPKTFFVSHARKDLEMASGLIISLRQRGLEVLLGEHEIGSEQMAQASIEQALQKSDICVILWSQSYAVSPWCYDELILATKRFALGQMGVWLFNLDGSVVVPIEARKLTGISVRSSSAMERVVGEILTKYE
jgi:nucleoside phosphorylase